ncbi:MAG: hypothetical protein EHM75_05580 [Desulfobacteraceae bacterium]|nr:MAG: hypothetical protein EHM75_05580 [Desulfobacteraceae bacterium]
MNLFEYTGGDPINYMDPSGTDFEITRAGIYSASNVPIDVVWTEPVPSGGYFPKWRNDYLGTPSRTPGTYWGGVSPGKEIMPFELQPKAIMPKNVQPQNLWGLAPVEKTSVKGMSWWKLPPETPVGLPEGLATSPETDKMVTDWWYKKGQFSGKGTAPLQKSITVRGGGGPSVKGAVMEGGMAFYLGYLVFDTYMNQGKVWDSFDNSWKPWGQYKEEHIFNNLPPWMKNAWAQGTKWMGENEFGADVLVYGPVQGPTVYFGDWLKSKLYSFVDGLTKKW